MHPRSITGAAVAAAAMFACRSDQPADHPDASPAAAAANVATYDASEFQLSGPGQLPAGRTRFRLVNKGQEPHHLMVVRLEEGRTYDSLLAVLKQPGMPPRWVHPIGGPNGVSPAHESEAELVLTPGQYAVACMVPSTDGVPHLAKGMIAPLTVTEGESKAPEPAADLEIALTDYAFGLSSPLTAGTRTVRVTNGAQQLHEIVVARLEPGKTMEDLLAWEIGGRQGAAPGQFVGGMSPLAPGDVGDFSMRFEPGTYGFLCFIPDAGDGRPHVAHGMMQTVTVS
jgi:uncharacterized cupredoxin-like copper-binding protein